MSWLEPDLREWYNTSQAFPRHRTVAASDSPGVLYIVATPIGNLEDFTFRAVRILGEVSLIAAEDTRRTAKLLRHYDVDTPTRSFHAHNEHERAPHLLALLASGRSIALVSDAGTPLLSDPGTRLVQQAVAKKIPVRAIPGASAVLAALVSSGLSDTQFTFVGFPPNKSNARKLWFATLQHEPRPLVMFEAPHRIRRSLEDMREVLGDRDIAVCRELTKIHEELVKQPISEILTRIHSPRGEYTIVVAEGSKADESVETVVEGEKILHEFGQLIKNGTSRRGAITQIARRYGLGSRTVYKLIEDCKQSRSFSQS